MRRRSRRPVAMGWLWSLTNAFGLSCATSSENNIFASLPATKDLVQRKILRGVSTFCVCVSHRPSPLKFHFTHKKGRAWIQHLICDSDCSCCLWFFLLSSALQKRRLAPFVLMAVSCQGPALASALGCTCLQPARSRQLKTRQ